MYLKGGFGYEISNVKAELVYLAEGPAPAGRS